MYAVPWTTTIWCAVLAWLLLRLVQMLLLSPLRKVPGPLLNRISSLPHALHTVRGDRIQWVESLHERYGDEVILEPKMVITRSSPGVRTIYGSTSLIKSAFYDGLGFSGAHKHVLQLRDTKQAVRTRKHISAIMQKDNLARLEPLFHKYISKFRKGIDAQVGQDGACTVDLMLWLRLLAFDIVLEASFGKDFGQLDIGGVSDITQAMFDALRHGVMKGLIPGINIILKNAPIASWNRIYSSEARFLSLGAEGLHSFKKQRDEACDYVMAPEAMAPLFGPNDEDSLIKELGAFVIAGSDTTSTTLLYMFYEMALHPELQEELYKEIASVLSPAEYGTISRASVESVPLLHAYIKETLRMHPAVPGFLPRDVPPNGITLGRYVIPSGTVVSSSIHQTLRNPDVYADPNTFKPSRWLDNGGAEGVSEDMNRSFIPFSSGLRTCVGQAFAWSELYIIAATVTCLYEFSLPPETTPDSMEMVEGFFTLPKSGKCVLTMRKRM